MAPTAVPFAFMMMFRGPFWQKGPQKWSHDNGSNRGPFWPFRGPLRGPCWQKGPQGSAGREHFGRSVWLGPSAVPFGKRDHRVPLDESILVSRRLRVCKRDAANAIPWSFASLPQRVWKRDAANTFPRSFALWQRVGRVAFPQTLFCCCCCCFCCCCCCCVVFVAGGGGGGSGNVRHRGRK